MSQTIDERVVELQFDNKQFEEGTKESMSTLEKLKNSLNFKQATENIQELEQTGKNFNLDGIANAVDYVQYKFSAWEIAAASVIQNITWRIMNTLVPALRSLSIGQMSVGWGKYADITQSIQTIMAATGKDMDYVSEQAEKLLWFTDETSFSLRDMTSNISKFTSSGIELEKAIPEMMGIATASALAGANIQDASHAMMGFSKAIAQGYMGSNQWQWIQTAHLDTVRFKEAMLEAAVAEKTLKKARDGTYRTLKGNVVSAENFGSLSEKWLTSAAMEKALAMYGDFANLLNEVSVATDYTASELLEAVDDFIDGHLDLAEISKETGVDISQLEGWFKKLGSTEMEVGRKAFKAAQEAKTFEEAIQSVKDAVSTGWMSTFQLIFGNYEEAKVLWTDLANELYDVFAEGGNKRNEILEQWHELGGYQRLFGNESDNMGLFWRGWNNVLDVVTAVKEAYRDIFPYLTGEQLVEFTKWVGRLVDRLAPSEELLNTISRGTREVFKLIKAGLDTAKGFVPLFEKATDAREKFKTPILNVTEAMVKGVDRTTKAFDKFDSSLDAIRAKANFLKDGGNRILHLTKPLEAAAAAFGKNGLDKNLLNFFLRYSGIAEDKKMNLFGEGFYTMVDLLKKAKKVTDPAARGFEFLAGSFNNLKSGAAGLAGVSAGVKTIFDTFSDPRAENVSKIASGIMKAFSLIQDVIKGLIRVGKVLFDIGVQIFDGILTVLGSIFEGVGDLADKIHEGGVITNFFEAIALTLEKIRDSGVIETVFGTLARWIDQIKNSTILKGVFDILTNGMKAISDRFGEENGENIFSRIFSSLGEGLSKLDLGDMVKILAGIWAGFKIFNGGLKVKWISDFIGTLGDLFGDLDEIVYKFRPDIGYFKSLVLAILALAAAMYLLSKVDTERLFSAAAVIGVLAGGLWAMVMTIDTRKIYSSAMRLNILSPALIGIARSVFILAMAVKSLAKIEDPDVLWQSVIAIGVILAAVVGAAMTLSNYTTKDYQRKTVKGLSGILAIAAAVLILTKAVKSLADVPFLGLIKGLVSVGLLLAGIVGFMYLISGLDGGLKFGTRMGVVALARSIVILSRAVKSFGEMDEERLQRGLAATALMLIGLGVFIRAINGTKGIFAASTGMLRLSVALLIIAKAIGKLGDLSIEQIFNGFLGLARSLAAMTIAMNLMPDDHIISKSLAFIAMGLSLKMVSDAIANLNGMNLEAVASALIALGGALAEIVAAAFVLDQTNSEGGAVAMVALAFAIKLMAPAIVQLAKLELEEVGNGLLALGGALIEIGIASVALAPNLITLIPLALALIGIGLGAFLAGENLGHMAKGLERLKERASDLDGILTPAMNKLKKFGTRIIELGGDVVEAFTNTKEQLEAYLPEYYQLGRDLVLQLTTGILEEAPTAVTALANMMAQGIQRAKDVAGIASPSTAYEQIGIWINQGLVNGLKESRNDVYTFTERVQKNLIIGMHDIREQIQDNIDESMSLTAKISRIVDGDSIDSAMAYLSSNHPDVMLNLSGAANKAVGVDNLINFNKQGKLEFNTPDGTSIDGMNISFTQNNYSPKSLSRMDIYRQTQNQISAMKGLVRR